MAPRMTVFDRFVMAFSPKAAFDRMRYQAAAQTMSGTFHTGASTTKRSLRGFAVRSGTPDDELVEIEALKERSRDLYRNNPIAGGALKTIRTNVVGHGLQLQSRIDADYLGLTEDQASEKESEIESLWYAWADHNDADAARRLNFNEIQEMAFLQTLIAGDVIALLPLVKRPGTVSDLRVQLVDADRLSNQNGMPDNSTCLSGVEVGKYGEPVAYWIETTAPGKIGPRSWSKVMAFGSKSGRQNVIHLFHQERPGQRRGVPYLSPVIDTLKQISRYTDSELMAAVVSAMYTTFITTENGEDISSPILGSDQTEATQAESTEQSIELGPGAVVSLNPGEKVEFANPGRPNAQFDPFISSLLKQVGMALELPYELLVRHFQASYSASRAALLEAWKFFRAKRIWLAMKFCQPIYEEFLTDCVATGKLELPGFLDDVRVRRAWAQAEWVGPAPGQIDPVRETTAAEMRVKNNFSTEANEAAGMGTDWMMNVKQRAKEERIKRELGLTLSPSMVEPAGPGRPPKTDQGQPPPSPQNQPDQNNGGQNEQTQE